MFLILTEEISKHDTEQESHVSNFQKLYQLDVSASRSVYLLKPISLLYPDYLSESHEKRAKAERLYSESVEVARKVFRVNLLRLVAKKRVSAINARKYLISILHSEIDECLLGISKEGHARASIFVENKDLVRSQFMTGLQQLFKSSKVPNVSVAVGLNVGINTDLA